MDVDFRPLDGKSFEPFRGWLAEVEDDTTKKEKSLVLRESFAYAATTKSSDQYFGKVHIFITRMKKVITTQNIRLATDPKKPKKVKRIRSSARSCSSSCSKNWNRRGIPTTSKRYPARR